jgi:hypothetical protein
MSPRLRRKNATQMHYSGFFLNKNQGDRFMMPRDYLTADQLLQGGGGGRIS